MGTWWARSVVRCSRLRGRDGRGYVSGSRSRALTLHGALEGASEGSHHEVLGIAQGQPPLPLHHGGGERGERGEVASVWHHLLRIQTAFSARRLTGAKGRRPRSPVDLERCRSRRCGRVGRRARLVSRAVGAWSRAGPCATVPTRDNKTRECQISFSHLARHASAPFIIVSCIFVWYGQLE